MVRAGAETGARRAAAIGRCDRPRIDASEQSCRGVAIAYKCAIFARLCTRKGHGRRRSRISAGHDRARGACHFRHHVSRRAPAGSAQSQQSMAAPFDLELTLPARPDASRLRCRDTDTAHFTAAQAALPDREACAGFAATPARVANETSHLAAWAEHLAAFESAASRHCNAITLHNTRAS